MDLREYIETMDPDFVPEPWQLDLLEAAQSGRRIQLGGPRRSLPDMAAAAIVDWQNARFVACSREQAEAAYQRALDLLANRDA